MSAWDKLLAASSLTTGTAWELLSSPGGGSSAVWPAEADVRLGVAYGPTGADYQGTSTGGVTLASISGVSKYTSQDSGVSYVELTVV